MPEFTRTVVKMFFEKAVKISTLYKVQRIGNLRNRLLNLNRLIPIVNAAVPPYQRNLEVVTLTGRGSTDQLWIKPKDIEMAKLLT